MNQIPVVIVHIGDSYYLQDIVEMNALKNTVIFVGCDKNAYLAQIPNVKHIHHSSLKDSYTEFMRENYIKLDKGFDSEEKEEVDRTFQTLNESTIRFLWILRVYYVKKILEQENLEFVFHLDSDCVLLENTKTLVSSLGKTLAYSIEHIHNDIHMVGSIHNSLLNRSFCDAFLNLYENVYANKTKRYLLKEKIDRIASGKLPGNICDMNLYYLLWKENTVEITDLTHPFFVDDEFCAFDHNLHASSGFDGPNTYKMTKDALSQIKVLTFENGKIYQETQDGRKIRLLSLHFNDCAKKRVSEFRQLLSF